MSSPSPPPRSRHCSRSPTATAWLCRERLTPKVWTDKHGEARPPLNGGGLTPETVCDMTRDEEPSAAPAETSAGADAVSPSPEIRRAEGGKFAPGVSGNPGGRSRAESRSGRLRSRMAQLRSSGCCRSPSQRMSAWRLRLVRRCSIAATARRGRALMSTRQSVHTPAKWNLRSPRRLRKRSACILSFAVRRRRGTKPVLRDMRKASKPWVSRAADWVRQLRKGHVGAITLILNTKATVEISDGAVTIHGAVSLPGILSPLASTEADSSPRSIGPREMR